MTLGYPTSESPTWNNYFWESLPAQMALRLCVFRGRHDLPGLTVSVELRTTRIGHPCKVTWAFLCRHTLPIAVLIEPLRTNTARFTFGGYLVGRQGS